MLNRPTSLIDRDGRQAANFSPVGVGDFNVSPTSSGSVGADNAAFEADLRAELAALQARQAEIEAAQKLAEKLGEGSIVAIQDNMDGENTDDNDVVIFAFLTLFATLFTHENLDRESDKNQERIEAIMVQLDLGGTTDGAPKADPPGDLGPPGDTGPTSSRIGRGTRFGKSLFFSKGGGGGKKKDDDSNFGGVRGPVVFFCCWH